MSARHINPPDRTTFNINVWDLVKQIPPGKVATYGQIASLLAPPEGVEPHTYKAFSPRWVGSAMAACPDDVPWQRVINAQRKISVRPSGGHFRQRELLEAEGIHFDERERIDLIKYGWKASRDSSGNSWKQTAFDDLLTPPKN